MRTPASESGFTLIELMISTSIVLIALGVSMMTFKNSVAVNQAATQTADANQNLRAGANLLIRDLLQAARGIPTGGIPIPSGAGATAINLPSPPNSVRTFDNVASSELPAIITGFGLGPTVDGEATDIITMLMTDTILGALTLNPNTPPKVGDATLAANGASISVGVNTAWLTGNVLQGIPPVSVGDLMWIQNATGSTLQTVTRVDATHAYFDALDWFNFNQPAAAAGSVTQIVANPMPQGTVTRILMYTYYVDNSTTPGTPRLTKMVNARSPQALAGVVEDLNITYDLVDGVNNPVGQTTVPYTDGNGNTYSANQIRKVNLHMGVRSDTLSAQQNDYIRNHLSTVVSIRSLAFVNRYQ